MQKKVRNYISSCYMLEEGKQVIAAVSGGTDSVCLFHLPVGLRKELHIGVSATYVRHGIRGEEVNRDISFTEELCRSLEVLCLMARKDVPGYAARHSMFLEETGRYLRYRAFGEEAKRLGGVKIVVVHHSGDQAETILCNLLRGSSLKRLGGVELVRDGIIRPLLIYSREEILDYLGQNGLTYRKDSTNIGGDYTRNCLHNAIIPQLVSEVNYGAVEHIIRAGDVIGQANARIEKTTVRELEVHRQREEERVGMDMDVLKELDGIVGSCAIMEMIARLSGFSKDITSRHMALIRELLDGEMGARPNLPYVLAARRSYTKLWIERKGKSTPVDNILEVPLLTPVFIMLERERHQKFLENEYTKWFDYDKIKDTLSVRTWQTGDYITLRDGKRKTVKSHMINRKIERELQDGIPLLAEGNHVLWIVGYRISECYKIAEETKKIL